MISLASIVLSWGIFTGLVLILSKQFLHKSIFTTENVITTAIFLGIALLPLGVFPLLLSVNLFKLNQPIVPLGLLILLQLWVILLAACGVSVQFFIRMERAGILSLVSIYIMVLFGLILGY